MSAVTRLCDFSGRAVWLLCWLFSAPGSATETDGMSGLAIMQQVNQRHEIYPYVYEEQSMVLMDKQGHRDVRTVRRYSRFEVDGTIKYLLVFDSPPEVRGVALRAIRSPDGTIESGVYLPAFKAQIMSTPSTGRSGQFLGTDFSIDDLTADLLSDYNYQREEDRIEDEFEYFVVRATPGNSDILKMTGYSSRRHVIRKDNYYIIQTDYFDLHGREFKRQTRYELQQVDHGAMWRANMVLMEDSSEEHMTLIKVNHRVFSPDYVPSKIFTEEWLLSNRHVLSTAGRLFSDVQSDTEALPEEAE